MRNLLISTATAIRNLRYRRLKKRWKPVLVRLRIELSKENTANLDMLATYGLMLEGKASRPQMRAANRQLKESLKTLGLGGLLLLPFSPITLPWVILIATRLNIRVLPDWYFRSIASHSDAQPRLPQPDAKNPSPPKAKAE
ncbi:MAG: hypothetical protein ACR2PW_05045 [Gammaproteobacteria bacterium]